ncbi:MAG: 3-hydroxyacyl-ACP dehydratase FabZ [Pseudomonadota bacterium]|nr:3-hydroxyacyl-ACP dehydratase FabZ [Pseudomonadota bacterium]
MMNINEIQSILPHRAPFLQVDRVLELVPGEHIVAVRGISINEPMFDGHFPGNPIFPGVLIIEAMAQTAGLLAFKTLGRGASSNKAYVVAGVDKTKFRRSVTPGEQLTIRATIMARKRSIWKFHAEATVDGQTVATADITCAERDL